MNPDLTRLQARVRSAELRRRAELDRLAVTARASEGGAKPTRPARPRLANPARALSRTFARVGAALAELR
jgi:hypothetical protein